LKAKKKKKKKREKWRKRRRRTEAKFESGEEVLVGEDDPKGANHVEDDEKGNQQPGWCWRNHWGGSREMRSED